ncbi:MAG: hypothetical protein V1874_10385 [Spirochaetota bacterium]
MILENKKAGKDNPGYREELELENTALKEQIREVLFLRDYDEKLLKSMISNNEKLINRYLEMTETNVSVIKNAVDEFKLNLSNMNQGIQQMAIAVTDLADSTTRQNDFCRLILENILKVENNNELSFDDLKTLNASINNLRTNSEELTKLVTNVEDIAERLRYLSLNGKIQVAFLKNLERQMNVQKMGETAGFGVIADRMEKLSGRVAGLVNEQNSSTKYIIGNIMESVELSHKVENIQVDNLASLKEVSEFVSKLYEELTSVAAGSEQLSSTAEEFSASVEELSASIDSIAVTITGFHEMLKKEVELYKKLGVIADKLQKIADRSESVRDAGMEMMKLFRTEFKDSASGKPLFVMARLFATIPYRDMPDDYRKKFSREGVTDESVFLCLFGTSGDESDWDDVYKSKTHQAMLLPESEDQLKQMPMLARNFGKMGIPYRDIVHPETGAERHTVEDYSLEKQAEGSPFIPDQAFVKKYGIKSQIGVGGVFPSGNIFTCFLFSRMPLDDNFAQTFKIIPMALQMALYKFDISHRYFA